MSLFSRLFGSGATSKTPTQTETYKGMRIYPEPLRAGNTYRLAVRIEHDRNGETREHRLIRADTFQDRDQALQASIVKAKQMINEQGERLFD